MTVQQSRGDRSQDGELTAAISTAMVQIVREYTGRGPTKARTTIHDDVVLVMLEDTLTKGERALVAYGSEDKVLDVRVEFQNAMRDEAMGMVAQLTGCTVIAMMSANHIEPDLGAEVFVLDGAPGP
jgi:uncharacterized protein YbcI